MRSASRMKDGLHNAKLPLPEANLHIIRITVSQSVLNFLASPLSETAADSTLPAGCTSIHPLGTMINVETSHPHDII